jgi:hypothetical protein
VYLKYIEFIFKIIRCYVEVILQCYILDIGEQEEIYIWGKIVNNSML